MGKLLEFPRSKWGEVLNEHERAFRDAFGIPLDQVDGAEVVMHETLPPKGETDGPNVR